MAVATMRPESQPQYPAIKPGMMGMYIFLASEVMFFGSLFAVYFYLYGSHFVWPPPPPTNPPRNSPRTALPPRGAHRPISSRIMGDARIAVAQERPPARQGEGDRGSTGA